MDLLLFAPPRLEQSQRLRSVIQKAVPGQTIQAYESAQELAARLRRPAESEEGSMVVVLAGREQDLWELHHLRDLLADLPLVLILPNRKKQTIDLAHSLRPRFLTYADSDFRDVALVLAKMLGRTK